MALQIIDGCINCCACEPLCPTRAIGLPAGPGDAAGPHFLIDPGKCTECAGDYADPQCASICPIEEAILDGFGRPLNPVGSLTGVSPEHAAAVRAEIRAR